MWFCELVWSWSRNNERVEINYQLQAYVIILVRTVLLSQPFPTSWFQQVKQVISYRYIYLHKFTCCCGKRNDSLIFHHKFTSSLIGSFLQGLGEHSVFFRSCFVPIQFITDKNQSHEREIFYELDHDCESFLLGSAGVRFFIGETLICRKKTSLVFFVLIIRFKRNSYLRTYSIKVALV